jgi:para-nitrobenzyl esterase
MAQSANPVVAVSGGRIEGRNWPGGQGATFRGIPFAAPPVGDLRWRDPQPVVPWKGLRDASQYAASCAQVDGGWNSKDAKLGQEDCLYLNVVTPQMKPEKPLPVMVWIHGGANFAGSALGYSEVTAEPLPSHGVVLVTLQYRLGYLGFIAHPLLAAESPHHTSGNYGLLDQIAALRWVRENIAQFGGDPSQVTIFGQSAGAYNVAMLIASPLAKGLFHRAIEESSPSIFGARRLPSRAAAEAEGQQMATKLKAPAEGTLAYLRSLPVEEIIKATPPYGQGGLAVSTDGYVLPEDPAETYENHREQPVPLIVGNNAREFPFFEPPEMLRSAIQRQLLDQTPAALEAYGLSGKPATADPGYGPAGDQFSTDEFFRCYNAHVADLHSKIAPTWQYEYSHVMVGKEKEGASHSSELGHVFGTFFMGGPPTAEDRKLSAQIEGYWSNFAKAGDPNGATLPQWLGHNDTTRAYVDFTTAGAVAKNDLRGEICRRFVEAAKHLPPAQ